MKQYTALLAAIVIFALTASAQDPAVIPPDYMEDYRQAQQRQSQRTSEDIIWLDPVELTPILPSRVSQLNNGNWAYSYYGISQREQWIQDNAQRKVAVFIMDTAGELTHPALKKFRWRARDKVFTGEDPEDGNGHGTHVATCYAGEHPRDAKMGPATPLGSKLKLIAYKIMRNAGFGYKSEIADGWRTANKEAEELIEKGYFVIFQMSFGADGQNNTFDKLAKESEELGVYISAAAGNGGQRSIATPANGKSAHAIGAIDLDEERPYFGSYGPQQYASAPGVRIFGGYKNDTYRELSGTSMSSPGHGAIVAILASTTNATARQISHFMRDGAHDIGQSGWDETFGAGTAKLGNYIGGNPEAYPDKSNGNPDTPNYGPDDPGGDDPDDDPEEDEPTKGKQTVVFKMPAEYPVYWKQHGSGGEFKKSTLEMAVSYTSKLHAHDAHDAIAIGTAAFFTNRAFVVMPDDDFANAGYWVRHFYEMIMKKRGYDVEIVSYWIEDEQGRKAYELKPRRSGARFFLKRLFSPLTTIQSAQLNLN